MNFSADLASSPWADRHHIALSVCWTKYASQAHIDRLPAAAVRNLFVLSGQPTEILAHVREIHDGNNPHHRLTSFALKQDSSADLGSE
jgi:hypothetical protein